MSNQRASFSVTDLNLGVIGNCAFSALIDQRARVVWCCLPRFDGDPVFSALLSNGAAEGDDGHGVWEIDVEGLDHTEQDYLDNSAILATTLTDGDGHALEVIDYAPRFSQFGRRYRPMAMVRMLRPLEGTPRIRIRLRPSFDYGATRPQITHGSNHIRYVGPDMTLRLTTNAPIAYLLEESWFYIEEPIVLFLGPDETLAKPVLEAGRDYLENTFAYWRDWVRHLAIPLQWQEAVIRAAITLKLCWYEETGAIIAAMTTSIPEAAETERNWDYRYCWLRDAYFVVQALNQLGAVDIMEGYLRYLRNLVGVADGGHLQPVYGISQEKTLTERQVTSLEGYRGMGPVRVGNQAYEHVQHDVYGQVVLSNAQAFYDLRLLRPVDENDFALLEKVGERAFALHDQTDAGLWELRTKAKVHTYSSTMCWAACDRLAKIASHLGLADRTTYWRDRASHVKKVIETSAWNEEKRMFADSFGGDQADASLLLMADVGLLSADDPRYVDTVAAVETELRRGKHLFRYTQPDDFGTPENAFNICTFWYIEALALLGRDAEACDIFEAMLASRNHVGLLSEDIAPDSGELWGNFPQTYSLVGIINSAMRLSRPWGSVR